MKQKRAGGWGYYFVAGVTALARNRTAGCMLVEAHLASVPFSTLVRIVGCMLETVHPCPALVRIAGCMLERVHPRKSASSPSSDSSACADVLGGGVLGWVCRTRSEFMRNREMSLQTNSCKFFCFHFRRSGIEGDAVSKVSRYGGTAPASCDKPEGLFMI